MKTLRGFEVKHFQDDHGIDCSIQESSAVGGYVWLGVHKPTVKVMWKDVPKLLETLPAIKKDSPETNEYGWCTVKLPDDALIDGRTHLSREQAKEIAAELLYFARHGRLREEKEKERRARQ